MQKNKKYVLHYESGLDIAMKLAGALEAERVEIPAGGTAEAFSSRWEETEAFVFVGALAIAVRSVAPLLKDKAKDPALAVVSEDGAVAVPVTAGHIGGASDLARKCADILSSFGAIFVPTTSSDRSGFVAPDLWASRHGWRILLRTALASVIRKLISDGRISVWVDPVLTGNGVVLALPCGYEPVASQEDSDLIVSPRSVQKLVGSKPQIVPRVIVAGIGCRRGTPSSAIEKVLKKALSSSPKGPFLTEALREFRTAEVKSDETGLIELADRFGLSLTIVSDEEIRAQEGDFSPSAAERQVGLPGVSEQAAASAGRLLGPRDAEDGVTVAISISNPSEPGELTVVGTGPGDARFLTAEASAAISSAEVIIGYNLYVDLLPPNMLRGKIVKRYGMGEEEERVRHALDLARSGYAVALVSGGDPGLFGLAPLALSMAGDLKVKVLPGITAAQAAAKAIGAPYSNGIALLSLSDYLQPWDAVVRAMEGAESGDITVALYNPVKRDLPDKLADVRRIFSKRRLVLVRDAGRDDESVRELPVSELDQNAIDMRTLMIFLSPAVRETQSPDGRKIWLETRGYGAEIDAVTTPNLGQFLVLGGTSEGRLVASKLLETGFSVTVSVARDAGLATVPDGAASLVGARDAEGWISVLAANSSELYGVIDATHPFASGATEAIKAACDVSGTPLCRFERPESVVEGSIDVQSPEEAVSKAIELTGAEDVVFLSIGVNLIPRVLPALRSAGRGVLARMLPTVDSMRAAERAGLEPCEIIASWGPGGADLNEALCVDRAVKCVISKESGEAGGVQSKALAAQKLGLPLILIRRPSEPEGLNRTDDPNALLEWCGELAIRRGL